MLIGSSTTAFAYVDPSTEPVLEETVEEESASTDEEIKEETGAVPEDSDQTGTAFSVPGNGEVLDDITDDSSKEFLTVTTKNNQTFYIVIDRSASSDNVYMLSQIDENDLQEFLDKAEKSEVSATPSIVLEEEQETKEEPETEIKTEENHESKTDGVNTGAMAIILFAAAACIGGFYYFKIYKPKSQEADTDNEGLEIDDGLETVDETDEDMDEYEEY